MRHALAWLDPHPGFCVDLPTQAGHSLAGGKRPSNSDAPSLEIRPALLADHPTPMRGFDRASEGTAFLQQHQQQQLRRPPRRNVSAIGSLLYSSALATADGGAASSATAADAGGGGGGGLLMLPLPSAVLQMEAHRLRRGGAAAALNHTEPIKDGPKPANSSARQLSGAAMGEPLGCPQQGPGAVTTAAVIRRSRLVSRTASFYLTVPSQLLLQPRRPSLSGSGSAAAGETPASESAAGEAAPPSPSNLTRRGARRLSERLSVTQRRLSALSSSPLSRSKTSTNLGADPAAPHGSVPLPMQQPRAAPMAITSALTASPPSGSPFFQMLGLIRQQVEAQAGGAMRPDPVTGLMEGLRSRG